MHLPSPLKEEPLINKKGHPMVDGEMRAAREGKWKGYRHMQLQMAVRGSKVQDCLGLILAVEIIFFKLCFLNWSPAPCLRRVTEAQSGSVP